MNRLPRASSDAPTPNRLRRAAIPTMASALAGAFIPARIRSAVAERPVAPSASYDLRLSGAIGDGATDDSATIQAFLLSLSPGSVAVVPPGTFYLIGSRNLIVPPGIEIRGGNPFSGWAQPADPFAGCGFFLRPDCMIVPTQGSSLQGLKIYRKGLRRNPTPSEVLSAVSTWNRDSVILETASQTSHGDQLAFQTTAGITVGQRVFGYNLPNGATVRQKTRDTIILSQPVAGPIYPGQQIRFGASVAIYLQGDGMSGPSCGCLLRDLFIVGFHTAIQSACGNFLIDNVWADCIYGLDSSMAGDQFYVYRMRCEPWYGIGKFAEGGAGARPGIAFWVHGGNTGGSFADCFAFCWRTAYQADNVQGVTFSDCDCEDGLGLPGSRGWVVQNKTELVINGGTAIGFTDVCVDIQNPLSAGFPQPVINGLYTVPDRRSNGAYRLGPKTQGLIANANVNANGRISFHVQRGVGGPWRIVDPLYPGGAPTAIAQFDDAADGSAVSYLGAGFNNAFQRGLIDGGVAGGNLRGGQAVDLQVVRRNATQVASGAQSALVGGAHNTAAGNWDVVGGMANEVVGECSVAFGHNNIISGRFSGSPGGASGADHGRAGCWVWGSNEFGVPGAQQASLCTLGGTTEGSGPVQLTTDHKRPSGANIFNIPDHTTYAVEIDIAARSRTGPAGRAAFAASGVLLNREDGAATTTLAGITVVPIRSSLGAVEGWAATVLADRANGGLVVRVAGPAHQTVAWVATLRATEVR